MTQQERLRIFATYRSAGISHPCDRSPFTFLGVQYTSDVITADNPQPRPILYGDWSGGTHPETAPQQSYTNWDEIKLILKPLSAITNEDAIEVARIANPSIGADDIGKAKQGKILITEYWHRVSNVRASEWQEIIDYLRSKSYNCGYGNYTPEDLVKEGIVIYE